MLGQHLASGGPIGAFGAFLGMGLVQTFEQSAIDANVARMKPHVEALRTAVVEQDCRVELARAFDRGLQRLDWPAVGRIRVTGDSTDSARASYSDAKMALFDYIEVFYNQRRRHSTLGQISPAAFERGAAA